MSEKHSPSKTNNENGNVSRKNENILYHSSPENVKTFKIEIESSNNTPTTNDKKRNSNQNNIREYIEIQKNKRVQLDKIQKEKRKVDVEKQKDKIHALLRKQRENAIRKQKSDDFSLNENSIDNMKLVIDNKKEAEIHDLMHSNFDFIREKFKADINEMNESFQPHYIKEPVSTTVLKNNQSFSSKDNEKSFSINRHERLRTICNLALDLQTKLQETSVNVFNFTNTIDKENINDKELIDRKINYDHLNKYQIERTIETDFLSEKKLGSFTTSFPDYPVKFNSYDQYEETSFEVNKMVDSQSYLSNVHREAKFSVRKSEKPNWALESDRYSFFNLTKGKIKKTNKTPQSHHEYVEQENVKLVPSNVFIEEFESDNRNNIAPLKDYSLDKNELNVRMEMQEIESDSPSENSSVVSEVSNFSNKEKNAIEYYDEIPKSEKNDSEIIISNKIYQQKSKNQI
jgi:hypothetical protein